MSEKFSIITINIDRLNEKICSHVCSTGETNPYIFMNKETARELERELESLKYFDPVKMPYNKNCVIAKFDGYKIFIDYDLNFGEIEIR